MILVLALSIDVPARASNTDELRASVITCWPGKEVYELYGHTAIRIRGSDFDSVWNYGMFDYKEPNFIGRFVKGDLLYSVGGYPFAWFMPEYVWAGRRVEEQVLNLNNNEKLQLLRALQINSLPENRKYLYDYVKDNCSTRVWQQVKHAVGDSLIHPDLITYPTFREAMRAYHKHYPWYSLGIDVALAYPVDTLISSDDQLFLPQQLMVRLAESKMPDGRSLVAETVVLNEGVADATAGETPWWLTPAFWSWILFCLACVYEWFAWRKGHPLRIMESVFFGLVGLAGCVITYLVFFSSHEASRPNLLLMWLNPLALIVPVCIWWRKLRWLVAAYMVANIFSIIIMGIIWPFQTQSGNATFIPLTATDILLAAFYIVLFRGKGYKIIDK